MIEQKLLDKIDELKPQLIDHIVALSKIDSTKTEPLPNAPFGQGIKDVLDEALSISKNMGFDVKNIDNYLGYAQYGEEKDSDYICAIGHLDVVPCGEGWKTPPFSATIKDNRILGRGVLDNKAPTVSCLYALRALKELGVVPKLPIRMIFGCDEESGFSDIDYYLKTNKHPVMGFTPDCKFPVIYGERGRAKFTVTAVKTDTSKLFSFVNTYFLSANNSGDKLGIDFTDKEFGINEMRGYSLSEEDTTTSFSFTVSYTPSVSAKTLLSKITDKATGLNVELTSNFDPIKFEKDSFLVNTLKETYEKVTGDDGTPVTTTGGTYAKILRNIVPFGPSFAGQKGIGHMPNEWIDIDDVITMTKIYVLSLYRLSQGEQE